MRFVGIDIGKKKHVIGDDGALLLNPKSFKETAEGYAALRELLEHILVGIEATGHYWKNLAAFLLAHRYPFVVILRR